ncbi:MAG: flagellar export protein FliJ [Planctomycetota bacterium]|jgi:flagellar FliJ protein|nr:flagellar export protein FliJ [Planctomycetota bacterium]
MARRFRFNLEAVLRYRGIIKDRRQREFAEASRRVEEERRRGEDILRERGDIQDEIVNAFQEQAPFQSIMASYRMADNLARSATESAKRCRELEIEAEKIRQTLIAASRDKKVMESLKERRCEEFQRDQSRQEQALLDEMSIQSRSRRLREETNQTPLPAGDRTTGS